MQSFRSRHSYLDCIFAPRLLFFAVSGLWQTLGIRSPVWRLLATIHPSQALKPGARLSSFSLKGFVLVLTVSFIFTTILGVMMAVKFRRSRRAVYGCLGVGRSFYGGISWRW
jgi:hypothetical protein